MTVGVDLALRVREYPGDDSANARPVPFKFLGDDDLKVTRINADASETVLVRGTHYTVAGAGADAGGSVTPLAPIASGTSWRIEGNLPLSQPTDYTAGDDFPAESHERGLDRTMIGLQEARRDVIDTQARALLVPKGEAGTVLPPASSRTGGAKVIAPNPTTGALEVQAVDAAYRGPSGPANNAHDSLGAMKASPVSNLTAYFDGSNWSRQLTVGLAALLAIAGVDGYAAVSTDNPAYTWVRDREAGGIYPEWFGASGVSATVDTAAHNTAFAVAKLLRAPVFTRGGNFKLNGPVAIRSGVPAFQPNGADYEFTSTAARFQLLGIPDGEASNVDGLMMHNFSINAGNLTGGSGTLCIYGKSNSNTWLRGIRIRNVTQGYGILFRAMHNGGGVSGNVIYDCTVNGAVGLPNGTGGAGIPGNGGIRWFPVAIDAILTVHKPGATIANGAYAAIVVTPTNPAKGEFVYWKWNNASGGPLVIPAGYTQAAMEAAGFTTAEAAIDFPTEYSLGHGMASAVNPPSDCSITSCRISGGYYGITSIAASRLCVSDVVTRNNVRCFAFEWTCYKLQILGCRGYDNTSSGLLIGYGCKGFLADDIYIDTTRWFGEALINVQIACTGIIGTVYTENRGIKGDFHLKISVDCDDVKVGKHTAVGDCYRSYAAIESGWDHTITDMAHYGHLASSSVSALAQQTVMQGVVIDHLEVIVVSSEDLVPPALTMTQVNKLDTTPIRLHNCGVRKLIAPSNRHFKKVHFIERSAAPSATGITGAILENLKLGSYTSDPSLAARFTFPRYRDHFAALNDNDFINNGVYQVPNVQPWVTATNYVAGGGGQGSSVAGDLGVVTSGGATYACVTSHTSGATFAGDLASPAWVTATAYIIGDKVSRYGYEWQCTVAHTSGAQLVEDYLLNRWKKVPAKWVKIANDALDNTKLDLTFGDRFALTPNGGAAIAEIRGRKHGDIIRIRGNASWTIPHVATGTKQFRNKGGVTLTFNSAVWTEHELVQASGTDYFYETARNF